MTTTIPLKHWIKRAVKASNISKGTAALSPDYIESSLRIAIALTQQISNAEEFSNLGLFLYVASLPPPFPVACIDWADCITVTLKLNDGTSEHGESTLSFPSAFSDQSEDLDELPDKITQDVVQEDSKLKGSIRAPHQQENIDNISILNVDRAKIFYSNGAATKVDSRREKLQRIYSLGLVLYELFSGGELPPLELLVVASPNVGDLTVASSREVEDGAQSFANFSGLELRGFTTTLTVSDDTPLDGLECLGERFSDHKDEDSDTSNEYLTSSISNKRQVVFSRLHQSALATRAVLGNASIDCLSMKGVPRRLCDLICNMIDCINGDFRGNESYSEMVDVTCDLKLMLHKPSVYLHDIDVHKLSLTRLELDDTVFQRNNEFVSLQCSYQRSISGSSELVIITGISGMGKSTMANRLGNFIIANGGLFLSGKFDMQQVKPFSTVASAFNNYFDVLTREGQSERAILVGSKLQAALGSDLYHLIQVIPSLSKILCENSTIPQNQDDCVDVQQRLQYLFCLLVDVIGRCSGCPMTLFIDDLQWADTASLSIIGQLLKSSRSQQDGIPFFFLGTCRDDEMESDHSFWKMIDSVSSFGFKTTRVKLDCMEKHTVNEVISHLLQLSPRLVSSLSDIVYHKTRGNPLFITKMVRSLNREGLLRLSLIRHRWEWDEEKIQARALPDDVAMFFVHNISTLPNDVKVAVVALSCFGTSVEFEVIQAIETDLNLKLIEPLNFAVAEGFVNKVGERYSFCHDRIQEAAYSMIEEEDRCLHHMNYGLSLMSFLSRGDHDSFLFVVVTQLNLGGPSAVRHAEEYYKIANCNLIAGKRAMEMSDFSSAFSFFDHGITFLRKQHWQDQYDLSLDLFNLAAKCALAIKDLTSLTMICDKVLRNAQNFEDTLNISFVHMSALAHSNISESVKLGLQILFQLGVDIPSSSSREDTLNLVTQTQSMLRGISEKALINHPVLSDSKNAWAIKFLARLENSITQTNASQQPLVTIKIIQLTIENGMSPMSAVGFAYFGAILAELGDIQGGYQYTKLAKALLDKNQCNEIAGEVLFLSAELLFYIEPVQVTTEYRIQAHAIAMAAGDIHWACMNNMMYAWTLLWHGAKLSAVREALINAGDFSKKHDHRTSLYYVLTLQQLIGRLVGDEEETWSTDLLTKSVMANKNPNQVVAIYFYQMYLSLVLNDYNEMKESAEIHFELRTPPWHLLSCHSLHFFIGGLVSLQIFRETQDPLWAQRGEQYTQRINTWKDQGSSWNFENKCFLLDAENCYSTGNFDLARVLYEKAISSARQHKFIHEEALAYELAANFYFNTGDKSMALKYFTNAHKAYFEWGALFKATKLFAYIQDIFGCIVCSEAPNAHGTSDDIQSVSLNSDRVRWRNSFS